jgi:hypothetical protein
VDFFLNIAKSCIFSNHFVLDYEDPNQLESYAITPCNDGREWLSFSSIEFAIPLEQEGVRILGIPLGSTAFVESYLNSCLNNNLRSLLDTVKSVDDLHVSFYLWKSCAGFCKISFLMRCLPSSFDICSKFKELCGEMFSHYFGGHYISELTLRQASFSPSYGGFGLRYFSEYHVAANLASLVQCLPFLNSLLLPEELDILNNEVDSCYNKISPLACPKILPGIVQESLLSVTLTVSLPSNSFTSVTLSE